jgi:hypothetical protein
VIKLKSILIILILFGSMIHAEEKQTKEVVSEVVCNKVKDIFGIDADDGTDLEGLTQIRTVSRDLEHILVRFSEEKEWGCLRDTRTGECIAGIWTSKIQYKVDGNFSLDKEKSFLGYCRDYSDYIRCEAEDEDIGIVARYEYDKNSKISGVQKSRVDVNFYTGGYGLANYGGMTLTPWIGRLFCEKT